MLTVKYNDGEYWIAFGSTIYICTERQALYNLKRITKKAVQWLKMARMNPGIDTVVL